MPIFKDHPCEVCGTSRYKKTSDGGYVCKYGHQMVGYREEQGEENSMLGVRVTKRKKVANTDTNVKRLYGAELEDAYVRIFQFSLQVMAQSFITDLGFPAEYEYAIRELWLLYVRSSNLTLVNAHIINSDSKPNITSASKLFMAANNPEDLLNETDSDSDVDDKNSITIQKYEPTTPTVDDIKPRRLNHSTGRWPKLRFRHVIVFCYITSVYLGWPITINDIRRWCLTMRLPYLRIINLIPDRSINLLDLRPAMAMLRFPENEAIRGDVSIYVNAFVIKCGLTLPKFNVSPLIFRYCTQLFLPVEIYFCAVELYKKHSYEAIINRHSKYDENTPCPNHFYHDIDNHIMVVILVLAKFLYDLDDKDNTELHYDIPALTPPLPRKTWLALIQANFDRWDNICRKKMFGSTEMDLDFTLDFLKVAATRRKDKKKERKSLVRSYITRLRNDLIPSKHTSQWYSDFLTDVPRLSATIDNQVKENDTFKKVIGDKYLHYRKKRKSRSKTRYTKEYENVLMLACRITGCSFETMNRHLTSYEYLLINSTD